jgi:stage II sporulation protein GA (sporulation sigma-E factor processing peptidase)
VIIYLDIIFLYNFLIDWILLWSVAYLVKIRPKWYRLTLGAFFGATYTLFIFLPPLSGFYTFSSKICLAFLMVFAVFGYHRLRVFLIRLLLFYLVSFVLGGGLLGISYLLQSENEIFSGIVLTHSGGMGTQVTWVFIAIAFPCIWYLSGKGVQQLRQVEKKHSLYGEVRAAIGESEINCKGLLDTGNQLYEPITRVPVVIMEVDLFRGVLPEVLYQTIKDKKDLSTDLAFMEMDERWLQRVRVIPYRSVSRGMDLLLAFRPDIVEIRMPEGIYQTKRVLIGLNCMPLSSDGSYKAIIHPNLVQEEFSLPKSEQMPKKEVI